MKTEATKKAAVAIVQSGARKTDVARKYGVSRSCIDIWIKKYGKTPVRTAKPAVLVTTRPQLAQVYDAISTLREAGLI